MLVVQLLLRDVGLWDGEGEGEGAVLRRGVVVGRFLREGPRGVLWRVSRACVLVCQCGFLACEC